MKYLIALTMVLLSLGCSHSPLNKEWVWNSRSERQSTRNSAEETRREQQAVMAKIRAEHPDWDKAVSDDTVVVECQGTGTNTVCTGR